MSGEIYSSAVISQAMNYLGNDGPLNIIRSRCSVDEVISEEQQEINEALLDKRARRSHTSPTPTR